MTGQADTRRRRPIVLVLDDVTPSAVRRALASRAEGLDAIVVAPNSKLSRLDWLTNDEDSEREETLQRAEKVAAAMDLASNVTVDVDESSPAISDPVLAVEDALRRTPADEIIVIAGSDQDRSWLEDGVMSRLAELDIPASIVTARTDDR